MKGSKEIVLENEPRKMNPTLKRIVRDKYLYLMLLPAVAVMLIFKYLPMGGLLMAFEDYSPFKGIFGSKWVGFANFAKIFTQPKFTTAIRNTLVVSLLDLVIGFPAPILLALLINELENKVFKRIVQTVSYLPHFLSWISVVGIVSILFGRDGIVNDIRIALGAQERIVFLAKQEWFIWFLLGTMVWKETGWGTVIHLANLSSISPDLYEAANIDGANRLQQIRYITIPHMMPTVIVLLIFKMGTLFSSNFELIYGMQNPYIDFEVISTIVFQTGIKTGNYSVATAIGLMEGLVALILVLGSNWISKKVTGDAIL